MNDSEALAWLGRKVGWGFADGQWAEWNQLGPGRVMDRLIDGDSHGVPPRPDPFAEIEITRDGMSKGIRLGVTSWMEHAVKSPRPLETFMEFFWSDYFGVTIRNVRPVDLMFDHMNLLARHALGNFSELLRSVTIDAAMLRFLDGATNTVESPNENYGRELLELYSVGVGNFDEADVKAASRALTGWTVRRIFAEPVLRASRHDDTPQTLLGVDGVHDVDTTIDAVLSHPATAARVANKLAAAILGAGYDDEPLEPLIESFREDWELRPLVRGLLDMGIAGGAQPSLVEPFAWYLHCRRFTPVVPAPRRIQEFFRSSAQIPLLPPNVGGFPNASAYLSTSATIARFNMASHLAQRSSRNDAVLNVAADVDQLAFRLGLIDGFSASTHAAIKGLPAPVDRIAAALASPDLVVV